MKYKLIEVGREKSELFPLEDELLQSVEHYIILSIKLNISFPFSLIITSLQKNCYFIKKKSFTYLNVTWDIFGFYE